MEQCWDANPLKRPDTNAVWKTIREIKTYYQNNPNELPQLIAKVDKEKINMNSKSFTSKTYKFDNLPKPKNATEEEQKAFYISRSYDFSISSNSSNLSKSSNQYISISSNDNDSKESPRLSKKLKIENVDVQNDYEREFMQQQSNIGTNDEVQNNPSLHSEQDKSEILDGMASITDNSILALRRHYPFFKIVSISIEFRRHHYTNEYYPVQGNTNLAKNPRFYKEQIEKQTSRYAVSNGLNVKKVHSQRLGVSYNIIKRKYKTYDGLKNPTLQHIMEQRKLNKDQTVESERIYYKQYHYLKFDVARSPQQVERWNRLTHSILHQEHPYQGFHKPYILNRAAPIRPKQLQHLPVKYAMRPKSIQHNHLYGRLCASKTEHLATRAYITSRLIISTSSNIKLDISSIRQYSYGYEYACQTWRRHLQYVAIHTSDVTSEVNTNARYVISKQDQIIQMVLNTPDVFFRRTPPFPPQR
ncbi:hypothetical protein RhiirA5_505754 [Rhizophagus irregularis]|uniref:Serine-threonine/tyrosine-protein kinase catalytic domain-containing protein n=1 Tax=Rhizophagus irregularis TaxID=588596 RepID=A0A2N0NXP9_9GLOM|nr:hypothetical protein RhiirA5_505754 [Rhizophagus irregularis]